MTLTADNVRAVIRLTLPRRSKAAEGNRFLDARLDWLAEQVGSWPRPRPFRDEMTFPLEGIDLTICWREAAPRAPRIEIDRLVVGGPDRFLSGRVDRWLKARAASRLTDDSREIAAEAGLSDRLGAVAVKDTRRQWGSCQMRDGRISYSWRLILAPPLVRRAVVAHELAHLVERGHGPAFHKLADELSGGTQKAANDWLKREGASLHWIGREE
ncbi:MAG: YgjP-like metallopeptidase domain-containing protein [Pacificimonas sp.]